MNAREEARLKSLLDIDRTVNYEGGTYTYHPDFQFGTGDFSDSYPVLVVNYEQEAGQRDAEQPINDLLETDEKPGQPDYQFTEGARVRDLLQITVAADDDRDNETGVPWHIMVQQTTMDVWEQIRFTADINTVGPNGERPMQLEVNGAPSGPTTTDDVTRSRFTLAADYVYVHERNPDAVADAETEANVQ